MTRAMHDRLDMVVQADWLDFVRSLPGDSVDLVATDPAYPSMLKWQGIGTTARMGMGRAGSGADDIEGKFFPVMDARDLPDLAQEVYRVLKPGGHAYIMADDETERLLYEYAVTERVWPFYVSQGVVIPPYRRLVWAKRNAGMGYPFMRRYENVVFLFKGLTWNRDGLATQRRLTNVKGLPDVLTYSELRGKAAEFPTQKPVEMFEDFVRWSSQPGDIVLDPFCGSGTTAIAAKRLGRRFLTCDVWGRAIETANRRLADGVAAEQQRIAL